MSGRQTIELRLDVASADAERLLRLPALAGRRGRTRVVEAVCFDTPKQLLARAAARLWVETIGGRHEQIIEAVGPPGAGLVRPQCWRHGLVGAAPDLSRADATAIAQVARTRAVRTRLLPLFEARLTRAARRLDRGGARIEAVLERGEVRAGSRRGPVCILRLALESGPVEALFALARECDAAVPLRLCVVDAGEQGYALLAPQGEAAARTDPVPLRPATTAGEGFQAIMRACLRHFRRNEPALVERRDREALHQARVAMRRLRSALSLFDAVVAGDDAAGELTRRLKVFLEPLGRARNIDVFLESLEGARERSTAPELAARAAALRDRVYGEAIDGIASGAFRRFMLDLAAWIEDGRWLVDPAQAAARREPFETIGARMLEAWRRKLQKKGRHLRRLPPPARHRVRIAAKKLRYACEFFAPLCRDRKSRKRHAAFLEPLQRLQARLGELNDIDAGQSLAEGLLAGDPAGPGATGRPAAAPDERIAALLREAAQARAEVLKAPRFWRRR